MSVTPKMLAKVVQAKKRLRDLAAGRYDQADAQKRAAEAQMEEAKGLLQTHLDEAQQRLSGSGTALLRFEWERTLLVAGTKEAEKVVKTTTAQSMELHAELLGRERALRSTERVRDQVVAERAHLVGKAEQSSADDMSASRRRS